MLAIFPQGTEEYIYAALIIIVAILFVFAIIWGSHWENRGNHRGD